MLRKKLSRAISRNSILGAAFYIPLKIRHALLKYQSSHKNAILKRISDSVVGDVTVSVNEFGGEFIMSPRSDLFKRLMRNGNYEPDWSRAFKDFVLLGGDVVDVGANIGFYTIAASRLIGKDARVLSIEPTEGAFKRLSDNVARNGAGPNVILHKGLVSNQEGMLTIHTIHGMEEYSSINPIVLPSAQNALQTEQIANSTTIDALCAKHDVRPTLIKIDVEGAEMNVILGASETISKYRPIVMSELSDLMLKQFGTTGAEVVQLFLDQDYEVFGGVGRPLVAGPDGFGEIICVPKAI